MKAVSKAMCLGLATIVATVSALNVNAATEAISREATVFNDLAAMTTSKNVSSREYSVQNHTYPCCGNLSDDGLVTTMDVPTFVDVLLGFVTDPIRRAAADVNCDGNVNGIDIQLFVNRMLSGYSCE